MGGADPVAESTLLMDEVMEQVAILADEPCAAGLIVVRAEEGGERRVAVEPDERPASVSG